MENSIDFRDKISTVDEEGNRKWVYPKQPKGNFYNWRKIVSYLLLIVMFGTPFIKVHGEPFMLFNILERKFILFGIPFWPQDSEIFAVGLLIILVFIVLFTAVFGRIWCGWTCPQTIFMEMVFRRIEYLIEGDSVKQQRLARMPWNTEKVMKKGSKHIIFYAISFFIGNTFLAYIIGIDELWQIITDSPSQHIAGLTAMILFSLVFYWVFAFFREQVCTLVCPYGRVQSVLLDKNSIVVSYDFVRGEPKTKYNPNADMSDAGDCIDCHQCVKVCPTGIDIRNGTQLECINCTACIDACNVVMDGVKRPRGLIRYASYNTIKDSTKKIINGRSVSYTFVLLFLIIVFGIFMNKRTDTETTILRATGSLPIKLENGLIRNLYTVRIINKTYDDIEVNLILDKPRGESKLITGNTLIVQAGDIVQSALFIDIKPEDLSGRRTPILIKVNDKNTIIESVKTNFLAPGDLTFD